MKPLAILVTMLLLAGCSTTLKGAADLGRIGAGINLPVQPTECGLAVPHMALASGQELRSMLRRERAQLDVANGRLHDCWTFNEAVRQQFAK